MSWGTIVKDVKKAIAKKKPVYNQSGHVTISINGKKYTVRTDCSGYVSACISVLIGKTFLTNSYGFVSSSSAEGKRVKSLLTKKGFKKYTFKSWSKCKKYDIVCANGHVEIFSHYKNGIPYVYSNGSTSSVRNASYGKDSGRHKYLKIYRYVGK